MGEDEKAELLKLAKNLARSVTCSGKMAARAAADANDALKTKLGQLNDSDTLPIREVDILVGYRPQAQYTSYLAYIIGHLFGCLTLYRPSAQKKGGIARNVRFIGMGANPDIAGYLYFELWLRLKRERRCFIYTSSFGSKRSRAKMEIMGDDFALSQTHIIRRHLESLMTHPESDIEKIQAYIQAKHGIFAEKAFQYTPDLY